MRRSAKRYHQGGFGGVLGIELAGGFEAADAFLGRLRYVIWLRASACCEWAARPG